MSAAPQEKAVPPLPGAAPLKEHIGKLDVSLPDWCEMHGIDRFAIQKIFKGTLQRVSVELAFDIEEATGGAVEAELFIPESDVRELQKEKRRADAKARAQKQRQQRATGGADGGADGNS
jgi:hypothetical protein